MYLITCSGKKNSVNNDYNSSSIEELSFDSILGDQRRVMLNYYQKDIDWSRCLPAYQMYRGKLYNKIEDDKWTVNGNKILILSALFGWVNYDDLIPYYDLQMSSSVNLAVRKTPKSLWLNSGVLARVLTTLNVNNFIDLLSNPYRESIGMNLNLNIPENFGRDRGDKKGIWLNENL